MRAPLALAALLFWAPAEAPAASDCDTLWVTRNLFFHRAGHCFASTLGQQLFGNAGCTTTQAQLAPADSAAVARMRALEGHLGCHVNTAAAPSAAQRAVLARLSRLIDIPEPDEFGSACWGWHGPGATLHAGASASSPVIGHIATGQSLLYSHWPRNGWEFVQVSNGPGTPVIAEGWTQGLPIGPQICEMMAG